MKRFSILPFLLVLFFTTGCLSLNKVSADLKKSATTTSSSSPTPSGILDFIYKSIGSYGTTGDGFVSETVAWSTSNEGAFYSPHSSAVDSVNDRLYVADTNNNRIEKFVLSTGAYLGALGNSTASGTCLAGAQTGWCTGGTFSSGAGDGMFNQPSQVILDVSSDRLYVSDESNYRIQKFVLSTGAFVGAIGKSIASGTCLAGAQTNWCTGGSFSTGASDGMFNSARGIAIDVTNDRLYVSDTYNYRIQKFVLSTGAFIGTIGKSTASGTCVAGAQSSWCTGGAFSFGTSDGMFNQATRIALDMTNDRLYVADTINKRVQKFVLSTGAFVGTIGNSTASGTCTAGAQTSWCTGGSFSNGVLDGMFRLPIGIALDVANDLLYVSDNYNSRIQKFVLSTGAFIGGIGNSTASGTCTAGAQSSWCTGGTFTFGRSLGMFSSPYDIVLDTSSDRMFISEYGNGRIQKLVLSTGAAANAIGVKMNTKTTWTTIESTHLSADGIADRQFTSPTGVAIDKTNDRMYVSDESKNNVQKFVLSTGAFIGAIGNSTASGTCVAGAQSSWCTGGVFSSGTGDGMFAAPQHIAVDSVNDRLYVVDTQNFRIQKFVLSTGAFVGVIGKSTASGTCVAGAQSSWCTGGTFSWGSVDGSFDTPIGIAIDTANDRMYIADRWNYRIQKFVLSTGAFVGAIGQSTAVGTCVAGAQSTWCVGGSFSSGTTDGTFGGPRGLVIDVTNDKLYVADYSSIQSFVLSSGLFIGAIGDSTASGTCRAGAQTTWCTGGTFSWATSGDGKFGAPYSLAIDPINDKLIVADYDNNNLQAFALSTGSFIGALGHATTTTGTCQTASAQTRWCSGGVFNIGMEGGAFNSMGQIALDVASAQLYISEGGNSRVQQISGDNLGL